MVLCCFFVVEEFHFLALWELLYSRWNWIYPRVTYDQVTECLGGELCLIKPCENAHVRNNLNNMDLNKHQMMWDFTHSLFKWWSASRHTAATGLWGRGKLELSLGWIRVCIVDTWPVVLYFVVLNMWKEINKQAQTSNPMDEKLVSYTWLVNRRWMLLTFGDCNHKTCLGHPRVQGF